MKTLEGAQVVPGAKGEDAYGDADYTYDEKFKTVSPFEPAIEKVEKALGIENLYDPRNAQLVNHLIQALKAESLYKRDVEYVVTPGHGEVKIVDEFTGRIMEGRRWSEGLHQAVEAKERVPIKEEHVTLATITLQNYFRLYDKLSGMTGTAKTEEKEFTEIYDLSVVEIPTNEALARDDKNDYVYKTREAKYDAVLDDIKERHEEGQPVLVGTISVEISEHLSQRLTRVGIPHSVLNAKQHEREAEIIKDAGRPGAVTIATNMAGRGVDIKLGDGVREVGGLYVLGTERHESRRIDNQLRGRSGRQGDPGESRFYLSAEDDLVRLFAGDRIYRIIDKLGLPDDEPMEASILSRQIEGAQKKVEEQNFVSRKNVLKYDDVMNVQRHGHLRAAPRRPRGRRPLGGDPRVDRRDDRGDRPPAHRRGLPGGLGLRGSLQRDHVLLPDRGRGRRRATARWRARSSSRSSSTTRATPTPRRRRTSAPSRCARSSASSLLQVVDVRWREHLENMDYLREGIHLRGDGPEGSALRVPRRGPPALPGAARDDPRGGAPLPLPSRDRARRGRGARASQSAATASGARLRARVARGRGRDHGGRHRGRGAGGATAVAAAAPGNGRQEQRVASEWDQVGRNDLVPLRLRQEVQEVPRRLAAVVRRPLSAAAAAYDSVPWICVALRSRDALPAGRPARVLEIGCGDGALARRARRGGVRGGRGRSGCSRGGDLPAASAFEEFDEPGPFDAVVASRSLHHVEDLGGALDKVAACSAADGVVVLSRVRVGAARRGHGGLVLRPAARARRRARARRAPALGGRAPRGVGRRPRGSPHRRGASSRSSTPASSGVTFAWEPYLYRELGGAGSRGPRADAGRGGAIQGARLPLRRLTRAPSGRRGRRERPDQVVEESRRRSRPKGDVEQHVARRG